MTNAFVSSATTHKRDLVQDRQSAKQCVGTVHKSLQELCRKEIAARTVQK